MGRRPLSGTVTPFRFAVNFSYYGLSLDVSGLGLNIYQTQLLFGAVEVPSKLLVYLLVRHAGRRLTQMGMLLGTALTLGGRLLLSPGEPPLPLQEAPPPGKEPLPFAGSHDSRPLSPALSEGCTSDPEPLFLSDMLAWRTTLAVIGKGFSESSFTTVYLFTSELYPTVLR